MFGGGGIRTPNPYEASFDWTLSLGAHPLGSMPDLAQTLLVIVSGQSNQAQYSDYTYTPTQAAHGRQFLYSDRTLRQWAEPLFGPGTAPAIGSPHSQLLDKLITAGTASGSFNKVIMCFNALGGTSAWEWGPRGRYHSILKSTFFGLRSAGLFACAKKIWIVGQGENETFYNLPGSDWSEPWSQNVDVARAIGFDGPIAFAKQTYHGTAAIGPTNASVQAAQLAIASPARGIILGVNADAIGPSGRYDLVHWNSTGGDLYSTGWRDVIMGQFP